MIHLRQSTASQEVPLGHFVDDTDGKTAETALSIANTDIKVWKAGATTLANKNSGGATHISGGIYYCTLDATDTDTIGPLVLFVAVAGALAVRVECEVLDEAQYDALFGTTAFSTLTAAQVNTEADAALADVGLTGTVTGRIDAAVSSRLATAGYTAPLDAAGTRSAVGLASANLDTQLAAIDDYIDTEVAAIYSRIGAPAGASIAADVAAVAALVAASAIRSAIGLASANLDTQLDALPTAAENTAAVWAAASRTLTANTNFNDPTAAAIAAAVVAETMTELSAIPSASPTLKQAIALLYMALRNKVDVTGSAKEIHTDAGTVLATKALTDDGSTYSEAKMA